MIMPDIHDWPTWIATVIIAVTMLALVMGVMGWAAFHFGRRRGPHSAGDDSNGGNRKRGRRVRGDE